MIGYQIFIMSREMVSVIMRQKEQYLKFILLDINESISNFI